MKEDDRNPLKELLYDIMVEMDLEKREHTDYWVFKQISDLLEIM